jgi:hypothetical protein
MDSKTIFLHAVHDARSSSFFHHSMPHIFLLPRSRSYIILLSLHAASARNELHGQVMQIWYELMFVILYLEILLSVYFHMMMNFVMFLIILK